MQTKQNKTKQETKNHKIISIDWLTISVDCRNLDVNNEITCTLQDSGTRQFKHYYLLSIDGFDIGSLVCTPYSSVINEHLGLLKIDNQLLYNPNIGKAIPLILEKMSLKFKSISRLDVCCDFQRFDDNSTPNWLIMNFMQNIYKKKGQAKFKLIGEQKKEFEYQYLRFGSNTSDVASYLYNKSQEFRDVKRKIYIEDLWDTIGCFDDKDVWRLEFSIKGSGLKMFDDLKNEFNFRDVTKLFDNDFKLLVFNSLAKKLWKFTKEIYRNGKHEQSDLQLFDNQGITYSIRYDDKRGESNRSDKIFIRKMENVYCELREINRDVKDESILILKNLIDSSNLQYWYAEKFPAGLLSQSYCTK